MSRAVKRSAQRLLLALMCAFVVGTGEVRSPGNHGVGVIALTPVAHAGLLDDPINHVWNLFRARVLDKVWGVIAKPFEDAKAKVLRFVDDAKKKMETVFFDHVLAPAMKTAMKLVFPGGEAGRRQVAQAVATYMGTSDAMLERVAGFDEAARAIAERSLVRLEGAKRMYSVAYARMRAFDKSKLMDILLPLASEKLEQIVRAETIGLVELAWALLEKPVEAGLVAIKAAITLIPVVGSIASPIFGAVASVALTVLRAAAVELVSEGVTRLTMLAIDKILDWFRTKKAAEEPWLKGVFQALEEAFGRVEAVVAPALAAYEKFGQTLFAIEFALKDPAVLGTTVEKRYAGGMTEGELTSALGQLRDARGRIEGDLAKQSAAARTKLERELQKNIVAPSFEAALSQVVGTGEAGVVQDVSSRLTGDLDAMAEVDEAAGLAMQALMAADGAGLAEAERRLKVRRDALARLDYAAIHAELSQRIKEPIATLTVARMQERADASLTKLIDETLHGAGSAGAGGADNAGTAMMAGVSGEQARVLRRELEAAGRVLVTNAELGRALVDETLRAAGGAKQVSATALAAVPKVAAVVTLVKARVLAAQKRIEGLMEWVVRARKDLAVATKGGK